MRFFLLLALLLPGCAHCACEPADFEKKFYDEMSSRFVFPRRDITMAFVIPGVCGKDKDPSKSVIIGCAKDDVIGLYRGWWERSSCEWREALVFHELGHAALDLDHSEGSIMDPMIQGAYVCMKLDRKKCLDDLAERYLQKQPLFTPFKPL